MNFKVGDIIFWFLNKRDTKVTDVAYLHGKAKAGNASDTWVLETLDIDDPDMWTDGDDYNVHYGQLDKERYGKAFRRVLHWED